ncbi:anaerobic dimethyl sulfoxide reductase subunit A [Klebsiella aerogenes]|nr:anaerobic dimethyl sulfoxide reductase subunit A [Klebsiella aerogenes]
MNGSRFAPHRCGAGIGLAWVMITRIWSISRSSINTAGIRRETLPADAPPMVTTKLHSWPGHGRIAKTRVGLDDYGIPRNALLNWRGNCHRQTAYISQGWGRSVTPTAKSPPGYSMLAILTVTSGATRQQRRARGSYSCLERMPTLENRFRPVSRCLCGPTLSSVVRK